MPEIVPQDRLQPALLDRLRDDQPDKKVESRESRLMTKNQLREAVLRDLAWLFNATRLSKVELEGLPFVERSTVNYGLPAFSGASASSLDIIELERTIKQAIIDFEPRILPSTIEVEAQGADAGNERRNIVSIQIRGSLWAQPVPLELLLRTDVDLETGEVKIRDLTRPG